MKPDLDTLRAAKAATKPTPKPRKPSAAERTAALPLVDTREQRDEASIDLRGPLLRKLSVEGLGDFSHPHATHLVRVDAVSKGPICGAELRGRPESTEHVKVCGFCRIVASKIQGVIQ